jgi:creatinine deaminase
MVNYGWLGKLLLIGKNHTFMGEEALLKSKGISIEVLQNQECINLMRDFISAKPQLWNEDIGE